MSRQREIYIMSANYLQTLKWHGDADLTKHIVQFYTKARAVESLSGFYESVAQVSLFYFSAIRVCFISVHTGKWTDVTGFVCRLRLTNTATTTKPPAL